eukprot:CAMPEP_0171138416 /NCGR_PEP_ID=MMETSP0766_2-20121228/135059_1 /TAXON_ID=439317 /ORGANISM="Gambierdiscus australes, Strain CAWD 149" /LENGTH=90 /DNA_ID=CAMNT_0011602029 /DNA_START=13 /DNA_END=282 /DNA_ORIENTATION=-
MTDFHLETWNPAWSAETILVGFLSVFLADGEQGIGALEEPEALRRRLAAASWAANASDPEFRELFPEFLNEGVTPAEQPSLPAEDAAPIP